jgi:hypothetical protein
MMNFTLLKPPQIDHRHPAVREDLLSWGKWILEVCEVILRGITNLSWILDYGRIGFPP